MKLHTAFHPAYRLRVTERCGVVVDDELTRPAVGPSGPVRWPILTVALGKSGGGRVRGCGREHWFSPGDFTVLEDAATYRGRGEGDGVRALVFQWNPAWFGTPPPRAFAVGRFDARAMAVVESTARALAAGASAEVLSVAIAALLDVLRARGVFEAQPSAADLVDAVPPDLRALSVAVDGALGSLHARPTTVDLTAAVGRSAAHVGRLFTELAKRYHLPATGWRAQVNGWRLGTGAMLMTSSSATTDAVARILGYSSPTALCRAFAQAGLPSPLGVRERIQALR